MHLTRNRPIRFRRTRANSSVASAQKNIEGTLGLPHGSVKLVYPNGRKARIDSTIRALRAYWDNRQQA